MSVDVSQRLRGTQVLKTAVRLWWFITPLVLIGYQICSRILYWRGNLIMTEDSALYYYMGMAWVEAGRVPYLHTWDLKPPLAYELPTLMYPLSGGNPVLLNAIGVTVNALSLLGAVGVSTIAVYRYTETPVAALVTGITPLAHPFVLDLMTSGYNPKFPFTFALAVVVYGALNERVVLSAAAAAVMATLWQVGIVALFVVFGGLLFPFGTAFRKQTLYRAVVAVVAVAAVTMVPIIASGGFGQMVAQTVMAPVLTTSGSTAGPMILTNYVHPLLLATGVVGVVALPLVTEQHGGWWPAILVGAFLVSIPLLGQAGTADLLHFTVLISVAVGIATAVVNRPSASIPWNPAVWVLALTAVIIVVTPPVYDGVMLAGIGQRVEAGNVLEQCHIRMSQSELEMMELTGHSPDADTCWSPF